MPTLVNADSIHINPEEIPAFRREELARCILDLMEQAFSVPGEEERYQQWLKCYRAQKKEGGKINAEGLLDR